MIDSDNVFFKLAQFAFLIFSHFYILTQWRGECFCKVHSILVKWDTLRFFLHLASLLFRASFVLLDMLG